MRRAQDERPPEEPTHDGSVFPGFQDLAGDAPDLVGRLAAERRARGLTQTEVAARMGTSQSALARVESGDTDVRMSTVARYAAALDVDVSYALHRRSPGDDDD